jgi:hypothetical protein
MENSLLHARRSHVAFFHDSDPDCITDGPSDSSDASLSSTSASTASGRSSIIRALAKSSMPSYEATKMVLITHLSQPSAA